jgi:hypothetical protein
MQCSIARISAVFGYANGSLLPFSASQRHLGPSMTGFGTNRTYADAVIADAALVYCCSGSFFTAQ